MKRKPERRNSDMLICSKEKHEGKKEELSPGEHPIFLSVFLLFCAFSIYMLLPEKERDHDSGFMSWELITRQVYQGRKIRTEYLDREGNLTYAADQHFAAKEQTFDGSGFLVLETYYDEKGKSAKQPGGYFGLSYENREDGKPAVITYLDSDLKPAPAGSGYTKVRIDYDGEGRAERESYTDAENTPIECYGGYYGVRRIYDGKGLAAAEIFLDRNGSPVMTEEGYAEKRYRYDEYGNVSSEMYFDREGNPVMASGGHYGCIYVRNTPGKDAKAEEIIYLGSDGKEMADAWGCSRVRQTCYRDGTMKDQRYFDRNGNPVRLAKGQYGVRREGSITLLLNRDGKVMICVDNILSAAPWCVVVIACLVCILFCILPQKAGILLFAAYTGFILYETLMFRESGEARLNLIPFGCYTKRDHTLAVGGIDNIWLFVPFGAGLRKLTENRKTVFFIPFLLSFAIEALQYFTGLGMAEFDDVFNNTAGGIAGIFLEETLLCLRVKIQQKKGDEHDTGK